MKNFKGKQCPYKSDVFCQEGYCDECYIYLNRFENNFHKDEKHK